MNNKNAAIESYIESYVSYLKWKTTCNKLKNVTKAVFLILLAYVVIAFTTIELLEAIK
jgi:hypothetical protein